MRFSILDFGFSIGAVAALLASVADAGPITWQAPVQNVRAESGAAATAVIFRFRNDGDAPVTFGRVSPSCGCTVGELDRRTWAPGESGELVARVRNEEVHGRKTVSIRVAYESGASEDDRLGFTIEARSWCEVAPRLLWWRKGAPPERREFTVTLDATEAGATVALGGEAPAGFTVDPPRREDGVVVFSVVPSATDAAVSQQVRLRVTRGDGTSVERTVFLRVM